MEIIEEWRDVPEYEDSYQVSSFGRVRTKTRYVSRNVGGGSMIKRSILMSLRDNSRGYWMVSLYRDGKQKGFTVHRLVALAFLPPPEPSEIDIAHWDNDRKNNHVSNLRHATRSDNHSDKLRHGTMSRGEDHGRAKLTYSEIDAIRRQRAGGRLLRLIADDFGVSLAMIGRICSGKNWAHHLSPA